MLRAQEGQESPETPRRAARCGRACGTFLGRTGTPHAARAPEQRALLRAALPRGPPAWPPPVGGLREAVTPEPSDANPTRSSAVEVGWPRVLGAVVPSPGCLTRPVPRIHSRSHDTAFSSTSAFSPWPPPALSQPQGPWSGVTVFSGGSAVSCSASFPRQPPPQAASLRYRGSAGGAVEAEKAWGAPEPPEMPPALGGPPRTGRALLLAGGHRQGGPSATPTRPCRPGPRARRAWAAAGSRHTGPQPHPWPVPTPASSTSSSRPAAGGGQASAEPRGPGLLGSGRDVSGAAVPLPPRQRSPSESQRHVPPRSPAASSAPLAGGRVQSRDARPWPPEAELCPGASRLPPGAWGLGPREAAGRPGRPGKAGAPRCGDSSGSGDGEPGSAVREDGPADPALSAAGGRVLLAVNATGRGREARRRPSRAPGCPGGHSPEEGAGRGPTRSTARPPASQRPLTVV